MSSAFRRPIISRDIQELSPTERLTEILGPHGAQRPQFDMGGTPQVTSRQVQAKGAAPALAFLADFAAAFGSGPQAAQNQQQARRIGLEDFFGREQEAANVRSGQVQRGFDLQERQRMDMRDFSQQQAIEQIRANTRMDVAETQGKTRLSAAELTKQTADANRQSRETQKEKDRQLKRENTQALIKASRDRQASSQAHTAILQDRRLSQQEKLSIGAKVTPLRELEGQFSDVLSTFESAADEVGPVDSALGTMQLKTGGLLGKPSQTFSALSTQLARLKNSLLKIRSGSAVVDQEFRRIGNELPVLGGGENTRWLGDNSDVFRQKLELGIADVQRTIGLWGELSRQGESPSAPSKKRRFDVNGNEIPIQ